MVFDEWVRAFLHSNAKVVRAGAAVPVVARPGSVPRMHHQLAIEEGEPLLDAAQPIPPACGVDLMRATSKPWPWSST